jgi:formamidopyrimidine-DNA glycosylase
MPELPEVETFVRGLQSAVGMTIERADVVDAKLAVDGSELAGRRITSIERRGKHIVVGLDDGAHLVVHLRMSGRLRLDCSEAEIPYTRLVLRLDSGGSIHFVNPRRLGTARIYRDGFDVDLGVDPLSDAFTPEHLMKMTCASPTPIKHLLMDQRRIAGLGNIYAAEALWRAGIDPRRPSNGLTKEETNSLRESIVGLLSEAIAGLGTTLGSSVSDYRPTSNTSGEFQSRLFVYGREGEGCTRCGTAIARTIQQGRSTCFCPNCQT